MGFVMTDQARVTRVELGVDSNGSPSLTLFDKNGQPRAILGAMADEDPAGGPPIKLPESTLTLLDGDGKVIWRAPQD